MLNLSDLQLQVVCIISASQRQSMLDKNIIFIGAFALLVLLLALFFTSIKKEQPNEEEEMEEYPMYRSTDILLQDNVNEPTNIDYMPNMDLFKVKSTVVKLLWILGVVVFIFLVLVLGSNLIP